MRIQRTLVWLLWLASSAAASRIENTVAPAPDDRAYAARVWRTQDGLPENTIQAIAETPDGYLWIGTAGGLVRFDGAKFFV
jgi:ligand-binding sensor domain-containing protein